MAGKRAVILIHGLGDQSPMATLRGFVDAVWTTDRAVSGDSPETWTKPDAILDSRELRRITTSQDTDGVRTDFFEFYWAHLMPDTLLGAVLGWILRLFMRRPKRVPDELRRAWFAGWLLLLVLLAVLCAFAWAGLALVNPLQFSFGPWWVPLLTILVLGIPLWFLRSRVFAKVVGDAVRYLTAQPENIGARTAIRESGLRLLKALHEAKDYDRIIVVGHSLGAVIGYDILGFYWAETCKELQDRDAAVPALAAIERASSQRRKDVSDGVDDVVSLAAFRRAQREYARSLKRDGDEADPWLVTDFVTIGSPLTHAHFLLVDDREDALESEVARAKGEWVGRYLGLGKAEKDLTAFERVAKLFAVRANQREFPMCPPQTEPVPDNPCSEENRNDAFSYRLSAGGPCVPHHGAPFAAVRWTNIYAPLKGAVRGDPVGGPVRKLFGPGVKDVPLEGGIADRLFSHTYYWERDPKNPAGDKPDIPVPPHLATLRAAINLRDLPEGSA